MPMIDAQYSHIVKNHEIQNRLYLVVSKYPKKAPIKE